MIDVYSHPDGGHYVIDNPDVMVKMDDGRWEKGLVYRPVEAKFTNWQHVGRKFFVTTYKRWGERFTKLEIPAHRCTADRVGDDMYSCQVCG
jgi:hypothetical protein